MMEMPEVQTIDRDDDVAETGTALELVPRNAHAPQPGRVEAIARAVVELLRTERARARIVVKTEGRLLFVRQDEIDWVEAAGNYVRLHVRGQAHVLRQSMKNMEARLDPSIFVRIHRSAIVNVDRIRELQPWLHGEYVVILEDGTRLSASRVFSDRLDALIG